MNASHKTPRRISWTMMAVIFVAIITIVFLSVRAFQPPLPLATLESVTPGMSAASVRDVLGNPTKEYPSRSYVTSGTNHQTRVQWTYTRLLTFGYVNVLFDTNGVVEQAHYETF